MNAALASEVRRLGGDPTDEVWRWLLLNGPHGASFSWSQTKSEPPGYVGLEHLRKIIDDRAKNDSQFLSRARTAARQALASNHTEILRRGVQVAAALALLEVVARVEELCEYPEPVASDARACVFLLHRLRK